MDPDRHVLSPDRFRGWQAALNQVLSFSGMYVEDDGKVRRAPVATTLDQAVERANRLRDQLSRRSAHAEIFRYCTPEIIAQNYFHAVFEAVKGIAARVRALTGLTSDGAELVQQAFGFKKPSMPRLAINALDTETRESEQRGFANLLVGVFGFVRNPLAHSAKIDWTLDELDALDMMSTISLLHRKLDKAWKP